MAIEDIARNDLNHCKALARANKVREELQPIKYLVCSDGTQFPLGIFDSKEEALEFIHESILYDRWLYKEVEDECVICDYWIVECGQRLIAYVLERED